MNKMGIDTISLKSSLLSHDFNEVLSQYIMLFKNEQIDEMQTVMIRDVFKDHREEYSNICRTYHVPKLMKRSSLNLVNQ